MSSYKLHYVERAYGRRSERTTRLEDAKDERRLSRRLAEVQLGQLHEVVLQLSKNCFEIKKLCLTVVVSALVLISTLSSDSGHAGLDPAHFAGAGIVILFFYLLDCQSYFYQEKLRAKMEDIIRNYLDGTNEAPPGRIFVLGVPVKDRGGLGSRVGHALFNASMLFYLLLGAIDLAVFCLYECKYIG